MNRDGEIHTLVPIDGWSGGWKLACTVQRARVYLEEHLEMDAMIYSEWALAEPSRVAQHGDWRFGGVVNSPTPATHMTFLWEPSVTPSAGTPTEELIFEDWTSVDYSWPNVLMDGLIIVDKELAALDAQNNLAVDRLRWRDGVTVGSEVRIRRYATNQPYTRSMMRCNQPVPTSIRGDFYGKPVRIPPCLHPEVVMTSRASDQAKTYDLTPSVDSARTGKKLVIPATNHLLWLPHVYYNRPTGEHNLRIREERTVYPPAVNTLTYQ